jgi:hypothetical protein
MSSSDMSLGDILNRSTAVVNLLIRHIYPNWFSPDLWNQVSGLLTQEGNSPSFAVTIILCGESIFGQQCLARRGTSEPGLLPSRFFDSDIYVEFGFIRNESDPGIPGLDLFETSQLIQAQQRGLEKRGIEDVTFFKEDFTANDVVTG